MVKRSAVSKMIPYGRQDIAQADIDAVVEILRSDFLTQGPQVPLFEQKLADYCGAAHAVAVNSATSALHIACLALGLGEGDWLWTTPNTFVASANCALYCGAKVDFVDIDRHEWNLCPQALEQKLVIAEREGRLPKIVVPVHLCGRPCDMKAIHALSLRYGFKIIEDASHAIGGSYCGEPIGNCRFSDITVFSFHPGKIITTAEGGMALTNAPQLAKRMQLLRSHGITRNRIDMTAEPDGPWYYQQIDLGFNYRMTELQAALGLSQSQRLTEFVKRREVLFHRYQAKLVGLPVKTPSQPRDCEPSWHLYVVRLRLNEIRSSHLKVFEALRAADIEVNLHYIPVYLHPYYKRLGFTAGYCPEAERYYAEAISLPLFPQLTEKQQDKVLHALALAVSDK